MKINLWYSSSTDQWRWTLCSEAETKTVQESGSQPVLRDAMNDVANTVEYLMASKGVAVTLGEETNE